MRLFACVAIISSAIVSSHDAFAASFEPHPVGTVSRDAIEVGNKVTVPLPEGEWALIVNTVAKPAGAKRHIITLVRCS